MKSHRFDSVSLIFGALFLGVALWWVLAQMFTLSALAIGWVAAIALLGLGVLGIVASAMSHRSRTAEANGAEASRTAEATEAEASRTATTGSTNTGTVEAEDRAPDTPHMLSDTD